MSGPVSRTINIYINQEAAQRSLQQLQTQADRLEKSIKKGETAGKDMTREMDRLAKTKAKMTELQSVLDGKMAPSFKMLKDNVSRLRRELESMSSSAPGYAQKFQEFKRVNEQFETMKKNISGVKDEMNTWGKVKQAIGLGSIVAIGYQLKQVLEDSVQLALQAEGVKRAFDRLNNPGLLKDLREATKGTVTDLELMKRAVAANNFQIPVERLGTLLAFASRRARDTGESVDFLVNSIVTGIARKSPMILDNLGISIQRINEEFRKTGDFAQAAFNVVEQEMAKAGDAAELNADKVDRLRVKWENFKTRMGTNIVGMVADMSSLFDNQKEAVQRQLDEQARLQRVAYQNNLQAYNYYISEYDRADDQGKRVLLKRADYFYKLALEKQREAQRQGLTELAAQYNAGIKLYEQFYDRIRKGKTAVDTTKPKTLGDLQTDLQGKNESLSKLVPGTAEFKQTMLEIQNLQKQIDDALGVTAKKMEVIGGKEERKAEQLTARLQALADQIKQINAEVQAAESNDDDAEMRKIKVKYEKIEREAEVLGKKLPARLQAQVRELLSTLSSAESQEIKKKLDELFAARSDQEYRDSLASSKDFFDKQRQLAMEQYTNGATDRRVYEQTMVAIEQSEAQARTLIAQDYSETSKKAESDLQQLRTAEAQKGVDQRKKIEEEEARERLAGAELAILRAQEGGMAELQAKKTFLQERFRIETEYMNKTSNMYKVKEAELKKDLLRMDTQFWADKIMLWSNRLGSLLSAVGSFVSSVSAKEQALLAEDQYNNDQKKQHYREMLENKQISQQEYNKRVKNLDEELAKVQRDQRIKEAKRNKAIGIMNAIISTAQGVARQLSDYPWPYSLIPAGIVAGLGAAEIANIASTKIPTYAKGKQPKRGKGGVAQGPSHAENGIKMIDGQTGEMVGEMEGNEAILSVPTYENNRELVDALVYSSMHQGGQRINWLSSMPSRINYRKVRDSMSFVSFAKGKPAVSIPTFSGASSTGDVTVQSDPELKELMRKMYERMSEPSKAYLVWTELQQKQREYEEVKKAGSLNRT